MTRPSQTIRACSSSPSPAWRSVEGRAARRAWIRPTPAARRRQRAGDTSAPISWPAARPTISPVPAATSGSTMRRGWSCGSDSRTWTTPVTRSRRRRPYERGHEDRIRRAAGRAVRPHTAEWRRSHVDGGVQRTSVRGTRRPSRSAPVQERRRPRRRQTQRQARLPPCVPARATARSRHTTRASRPALSPGPSEPEARLARADPPRARWRGERRCRCRPPTSILRAIPDPMSSPASTSAT